MSALYESERKANLANENKIRSVMQTIKEDNMELMKVGRVVFAWSIRGCAQSRAILVVVGVAGLPYYKTCIDALHCCLSIDRGLR